MFRARLIAVYFAMMVASLALAQADVSAPAPVLEAMVMQQADDVQVWVADPLENILRSAQPPQQAPDAIVLEAAQDEYESGQVVVRAASGVKGLRASVSPLSGPGGATLAAGGCQCRFVGYVRVEENTYHTPEEELVAKAPVDLPDPLLEVPSLDVAPGQAQPVWVTVHVPRDAVPGQYSGTVNLAWQGGEKRVPLRLTVWPFALPRERHLYFTNWISAGTLAKRYGVELYSEKFWAIFEKYVEAAAEHHQNILWVSPHVIGIYREPDGTYTCDFATFDRWIEICQKHGVADLIEISQVGAFKDGWSGREIVFHNFTVTDRKTGKAESRPGEEVLEKLLPALQEHLRERGWLKKTVLHIADEPSINNVKSWRERADWVRARAPEIRLIDAIEAPDFGDSLQVWVPKLSHYHNWQAAYERARRRGAELWFYTCCHPYGRYPNRFMDFPLIKTRILQWVNWRYHLTGYLHWGLLAWNDDPFKTATRSGLPPGDAWIVYPGPRGPWSSIRWEALRDGFEDYEYLWLLTSLAHQVKKKLGPAAEGFEAASLADELAHEAMPDVLEYVRDPAALRAIRNRLAQEIIALQSRPYLLAWTTPPSSHPLASGPAVAVLHIATEPGAQVTVDGKPVELDDQGFYAANRFLNPGQHRFVIAAKKKGMVNQVTRYLTVVK